MKVKSSWAKIIKSEFAKPYFESLKEFVDQKYKTNIVYPKRENIFDCFNYFDYESTKVVILGQDPYINENQAHGLAFSVLNNLPPPSLKNIFKELKNDLNIERTNANLSDWAKQGVLLLNNVLTVNAGQSNSHKNKGWEIFTNNIIKKIDELNGVIFVLWGRDAQNKSELIINNKKYIIKSPHPSPLSANYGFFGSRPFSKINMILTSLNKETIKW